MSDAETSNHKVTIKMMAYDQLKFIDEVKKRPGLYSPDHPVDRAEKLALWKEIGAALYNDWEECNKAMAYDRVLQLQRKWRSLRDAYSRELRARRSGVRVNKCVYRYFRPMSFLGGFEGSISDVGEQDSTTYEDTSNVEYDPLVTRPRVKKEKKRRPKPPSEDSEPRDEMEMPVCSLNLSESKTDSDKLFLLSFLPEMRQLPVNVKMWARAQIANVMQEAVASYYNNTTLPPNRNMNVKLNREDSSE